MNGIVVGSKGTLWIFLASLILVTVIMSSAYADDIVKPTSGGTLNVGFSTDPANPVAGDQVMLKISFINKQNSIQQHIDYKVSVMEGNNQVFGIPVTHTAEGSVSIPVQFQDAATYKVVVEVDGVLFQPIPPETSTFTIVSTPEFGPVASLVLVIAIVGVVIVSARTRLKT